MITAKWLCIIENHRKTQLEEVKQTVTYRHAQVGEDETRLRREKEASCCQKSYHIMNYCFDTLSSKCNNTCLNVIMHLKDEYMEPDFKVILTPLLASFHKQKTANAQMCNSINSINVESLQMKREIAAYAGLDVHDSNEED